MKVTININGKDHEVVLTTEQIKDIDKQKPFVQWVKTYQDILDILGDEAEVPTSKNKGVVAFTKLLNIVKVFNAGWKADWNNSSEYKWIPWFYLNGGCRLGDVYYRCSFSSDCGGLVFRSKELAQLSVDLFLDIWKDYHLES